MEKITLIICEKPSVAQAIAKVVGAYRKQDGYLEGEDCVVSWCFGHLAEYAPPESYDEKYARWQYEDLPIFPAPFCLEVAKDKAKQLSVLKELLHRQDTACVINACDAGREGELIFWNVYDLSGSSLPVRRLWISSMEESAIRDGLASAKTAEQFKGLKDAATCRAKADWLVGINATRAYTVKYAKKLLVGRVQSPTLAMVVDRQREITAFQKKTYWRIVIKGSGITAVSDDIPLEPDADKLAAVCGISPAVITKVEKEQKRENPPKLYDLTALQRDANRKFGYTAQQTLDALQELYEKKYVTYPRTDARYITSDMEDSTAALLQELAAAFPFAAEAKERNVSRLICDSKVSDHHALLVTKESLQLDVSTLSERERMLYLLIAARMAAAASGAKRYEATKVQVVCAAKVFHAKGTLVTDPGYMAVEEAFAKEYLKKKPGAVSEAEEEEISVVNILDAVFEGKHLENLRVEKAEHETAPPKPYSEDTLLSAMEKAGRNEIDADVERKGIGTPATRAGIIEKLITSGYVKRKGKQLLATEAGEALYDVLPANLKSASLTADWENRLLAIEKGEEKPEDFMEAIVRDVELIMGDLEARPQEELDRFHQTEILGKCPKCGGNVKSRSYGAYCADGCGMSFRVYGKAVDDVMVKELLSGNPIKVRNKGNSSGRTYKSILYPEGIEKYTYEKKAKRKRATAISSGRSI